MLDSHLDFSFADQPILFVQSFDIFPLVDAITCHILSFIAYDALLAEAKAVNFAFERVVALLADEDFAGLGGLTDHL